MKNTKDVVQGIDIYGHKFYTTREYIIRFHSRPSPFLKLTTQAGKDYADVLAFKNKEHVIHKSNIKTLTGVIYK